MVEHLDELREQIGFAAFQDHAHLAPEIALATGGFGGGEDTFLGQLTAGAEAAVQFVEVAWRPVAKQFWVLGGAAIDERVGGAIESARGHSGHRLKQFVDGNAQPLSQFVECASVGMGNAASQAAKGPLVEFAGGDDRFERQIVAGHNAAQVACY